jgi:hypothetical protein
MICGIGIFNHGADDRRWTQMDTDAVFNSVHKGSDLFQPRINTDEAMTNDETKMAGSEIGGSSEQIRNFAIFYCGFERRSVLKGR